MTEMRMDNFEDHFENNPRRKGHSKLVAKDGKIATERDSEAKQFSQAEVDALIAAAVALVVQKAATHVPQFPGSKLYGPLMCSECGMVSDASLPAARFEAWQQHILALADPNALAEHDAALMYYYVRAWRKP